MNRFHPPAVVSQPLLVSRFAAVIVQHVPMDRAPYLVCACGETGDVTEEQWSAHLAEVLTTHRE